MISRKNIKTESKKIIKNNFKIVLLSIVQIIVVGIFIDYCCLQFETNLPGANFIFSFFAIGLLFMSLNWIRTNQKPKKPLTDSVEVFKAKYFWSAIKLDVVSSVMIFLWSLLFVIPGIIKAIQYSQAFAIMKDHIDNDEEFTTMQCITESRELMRDNVGSYFIFCLSFIGWGMLFIGVIITVNIFITSMIGFFIGSALIYFVFGLLTFYYNYSKAQLYLELTAEKNDNNTITAENNSNIVEE